MTDLTARLQALSPAERAELLRGLRRAGAPAAPADDDSPIQVRSGLYFFASADAIPAAEYYPLVLAAAEAADAAGMHAIWLPERHFVDFGGFSPNPAVLGAAIAARTRNLRINAGSVAAPLQHPVRICEDWSVLDNISGGRAGISFASGWHPDDFLLARSDHAERKAVLLDTADRVRRHWRGEALAYDSTAGHRPHVVTQPRPVQPELPVWLTAAGSPETFTAAAEHGYGVMTALLGQTLPALRDNVARYRAAWRAAGHPGTGDVVVMVHAYVSDRPDLEDFLRPAMHRYLRAFRGQTAGPGDTEADELLESAYLAFLDGPSLLGTPAKARDVLRSLVAAGADEVGYLVDFGLPAKDVLAGLDALTALTGGSGR